MFANLVIMASAFFLLSSSDNPWLFSLAYLIYSIRLIKFSASSSSFSSSFYIFKGSSFSSAICLSIFSSSSFFFFSTSSTSLSIYSFLLSPFSVISICLTSFYSFSISLSYSIIWSTAKTGVISTFAILDHMQHYSASYNLAIPVFSLSSSKRP